MRTYNKLAIDFIKDYAKGRADSARASIEHVCRMSNIHPQQLYALEAAIRDKARIALHFHPFRLDDKHKSAAEYLFDSGTYKSQFETGISNGSPTAYIGGQRDKWENLLFGDVYKRHKIDQKLRPKYGALRLLEHANGPSPRFGSCYFLLKPELSAYATFSYMDSYQNPLEKGTIDCFDEMLACLFAECFERDYALGERNIRPHILLEKIQSCLSKDVSTKPSSQTNSRNLDHYIEAQIHTEIGLQQDIDCLVADDAYRETAYELHFVQICERYDIELCWYKGHELAASKVPDHFRGSQMPAIAREVATDELLNAHVLGKAEAVARQQLSDPEEITKRNQQLKYLWHTLVKFG